MVFGSDLLLVAMFVAVIVVISYCKNETVNQLHNINVKIINIQKIQVLLTNLQSWAGFLVVTKVLALITP